MICYIKFFLIKRFYISPNHLLLSFLFFALSHYLTGQEIRGVVLHNNEPLSGVNILVKNTLVGTKTKSNGEFKINATLGDTLVFSHLGLQTLEKRISKIFLPPIELFDKYEKLDEVIVTDAKNTSDGPGTKSKEVSSIFGNLNTKAAGYSINEVSGKDLNLAAPESPNIPSIAFALNGKVTNYKITTEGIVLRSKNSMTQDNTALWEIDGITYDGYPPYVDLNTIENVYVIKSLAGTTRYGSRGAGGVIIVKTINSKIGNNNEIRAGKIEKPSSVPYKSLKRKPFLFETFGDSSMSNLVKDISGDLNILRGLAYYNQSKGNQTIAAQVYREILSLDSEDIISHRNVAHCWHLSNKPLKAWSDYMIAFKNSDSLDQTKIRNIVFNEMEKLYVTEKLRGKVIESFQPQSDFSTVDNLMTRIVLEWSDANQDIGLEVVDPEGNSYLVEYGEFYGTKNGIEEFFLDRTIRGKWQFNFLPTVKNIKNLYLKVSIYNEWNSKRKAIASINLFRFTSEDSDKYQLFEYIVN